MNSELLDIVKKHTPEESHIPEAVVVVPDFDTPMPPTYPRKQSEKINSQQDLKEAVRVAATTAQTLEDMGMAHEVDSRLDDGEVVDLLDPTHIFKEAFGTDSGDMKEAESLINGETRSTPGPVPKQKTGIAPAQVFNTYTAVKLGTILSEYDKKVVEDSAQLRTYVTNKLVEASDCGDIKHELRALEMLGKISDVGLFAEKTEITVNHTADSLEHAIKDKIARILGIKESQVHDGEFNELEELQNGSDNGDDEGQPPKKSGREWLQQTKEDTESPEEVPHSSS
tara:strand:- start:559 stop:1407 length:849 start_codon:yes stop_codon:yes gene_type:complete